MGTRRTAILTGVAVAAVVLVPAGAVLIAVGFTRNHGGVTVIGIVAAVLGLVCLRALYWVRRVRLLTQAGLRIHRNEHPPGSSQTGGSG